MAEIIKKRSKLILFIILVVATILRLWKLNEVPVSLFEDELDVGYHAYSILKTGKDYSGNSWPLSFQSFADWRTPFNIYTSIPTVALFGITAWGVRLPVAIFGVVGVFGFYLLVKQITDDTRLALIAIATLAISPWHIQYSRVALEVSQFLTLLIFALLFFFKSLKEGKWFWLSLSLFLLTPLVYSTAKLFTPLLMLFLLITWRNQISKIPKRYLKQGVLVLVLVGSFVIYSTIFSGSGYRFKYINIFSDPTVPTSVDYARFFDADSRGEIEIGEKPLFIDKFFHNKVVFWIENLTDNYLKAMSTDFLFINGDPNLRHSIKGMGQFYRIESLALLVGTLLFFTRYKNRKVKLLFAFWILVGIIPSAITRIGGTHATRLVIVLPPLVFLIAYGIFESLSLIRTKWKYLIVSSYAVVWISSFVYYQHNFWVHYPLDSERMWHAEYEGVIKTAIKYRDNYQKIIISDEIERPQIFFAAYTMYDPLVWQKGSTIEYVAGIGDMERIDNFYFGKIPNAGSIDNLSIYLKGGVLYMATAREVGMNLILEPEKLPDGLKLVDVVLYPSGEPAFYALEVI